MDARAILQQLLQSGQSMATQGLDVAQSKLGVPEEGPGRDAMLSGMGKGAMAAGALALLLGTGTGRKVTGSALKLGSLAAVGGLAFKAFQNYQQGQNAPAVAQQGKAITDLSGSEADSRSLALVKAMIAAAKADGHIDDKERAAITQQMGGLGLDVETAQFLQIEMEKPLDPKDIAAGADSPEAAAEIYLISLMVINLDNFMERAYLDQLAKEMGLAPELAAQLEAEVRV